VPLGHFPQQAKMRFASRVPPVGQAHRAARRHRLDQPDQHHARVPEVAHPAGENGQPDADGDGAGHAEQVVGVQHHARGEPGAGTRPHHVAAAA
jgi:hypothetical protein